MMSLSTVLLPAMTNGAGHSPSLGPALLYLIGTFVTLLWIFWLLWRQ